MTQRPFYRSRLFWLGLPGLVFLLWGWLAVPLSTTGVGWSKGRYDIVICDVSRVVRISFGEIFISRSAENLPETGLTFSQNSNWELPEAQSRVFPAAYDREVFEEPDYFYYDCFYLAYWWLILFYLLLWAAVALVWQRRKSRLLKLHAAP